MITVETIEIQDFRGVRELKLDLSGGNFGISGPNGTGKSGVVDAIEFCLTGSVGRLTGEGTEELSVAKHAPHVDAGEKSAKAKVTITGKLTASGKNVTISRTVAKANTPNITPDEADVISDVSRIAEHPEFVLSRRDIVKYIITPAGKRDTDVKTLLRLERLDKIRKALKTADNTTATELRAAKSNLTAASLRLKEALAVPTVSADTFLTAVNAQREVLGLEPLEKISGEQSFKEGVSETKNDEKPSISKATEKAAITKLIFDGKAESSDTQSAREKAKATLTELASDVTALNAIRRRSLIAAGLNLVDGNSCPLCDTDWDQDTLMAHLQAKLETAEAAQAKITEIREALEPLISGVGERKGDLNHAKTLLANLKCEGDLASLDAEIERLEKLEIDFGNALENGDAMIKAIEQLSTPWEVISDKSNAGLVILLTAIEKLPDVSAADKASEYLIIAQERYDNVIACKTVTNEAEAKCKVSGAALSQFNTVTTSALNAIYDMVESDFAEFYRILNKGDEDGFTGKLTSEPAKLSLDVDFYGRGTFPPGAFHSEGHQDGMGLCLYLALMKQTMGDQFGFCVLDDVLMSVDAGHRRQVCHLLRTKFPKTQFVLTTHDRVWLQFMKTEKLVKRSQTFGGWSVETGPVIFEDEDVWEKIETALKSGDVAMASGRLRRYLEYVSHILCDGVDAPVKYKANARYTLFDLFPPAMKCVNDLMLKAENAAKSYGKTDRADAILAARKNFKESLAKSRTEEWAINPTVHYTEWENLTATEFGDVAAAFKALMLALKCDTCGTFLRLTYASVKPAALGCQCGDIQYSLTKKS